MKVGVEFDVDRQTHNGREGGILQINEQILEPCRPMISEGAFNAGACGPAHQQGRRQSGLQRPPILGSAFLFERLGVLTSQK